jgi:sodium-coupled neutral amino acid transporter 7/8
LLQDTGGASSLSSVATLCNSAIGAGVLSLPYAFSCAGLVGGLVLCMVVAAAESFSLYILSKVGRPVPSQQQL